MPALSAEERTVLDHLRAWYRTHRGALPAERVATATGLPTAAVCAAAGVLAVAAGVRTYHRTSPSGEPVTLFLDAPEPPRRVIDLTHGLSEGAAPPR
ncbi:hypothetical protein MO973_06120 [Paenibacillus sp. TRM 82003]|uniref:hypothetical protein n=1 Tax=Kineococcus sp. TRM81007 TaxID=2925831 RepID=UPI001F5604FE|nr:hypothetical protein [Kineococcus sp. TRM81007]MCI2237454.1 hypothetical protein [Kineococcus sp. TRM81007]MCI3919807.1 hypothetical protein [Paenibacillus sp. TRM 82003]